MPTSTQRGRATKDALARALITKLGEGADVTKITVRDLTDACSIDRQTFYYHFKNIPELAMYAYNRAGDELLIHSTEEGYEKLDLKARLRAAFETVENNDTLRSGLIPLLGESILWKGIASRLEKSLHRDLDEKLDACGIDAQTKETSVRNLSYAMSSILVAWVSRVFDESLDNTIDACVRMRDDYLLGIASRGRHSQNV